MTGRSLLALSLVLAPALVACSDAAAPPERAPSAPQAVAAATPDHVRALLEGARDVAPEAQAGAAPTPAGIPLPAPGDPDARPPFTRTDLMLEQSLDFDAQHPDPSAQRLAPLTSWAGLDVEFYEETFPDGRLRLQGHRHRDAESGALVLHGPEWRWYANEQIQLRRAYDRGHVTGDYQDWYEAGFLRSAGRYVDDRKEGEWLRWGPGAGRLAEITQWHEGLAEGVHDELWPRFELHTRVEWLHGEKHGVERAWDPEGRPRKLRGWKHGVAHGDARDWAEDGVLLRAAHWLDGERDGPYAEWYPSGARRLSGAFAAGQRTGTWEAWTEAGVQTSHEEYRAGLLDGPKRLWSEDGVLVFEGAFVAGRPAGEHREFYLGGGPKSVVHYVDGLMTGSSVSWHPEGRKAEEGPMVAGKRHGRWTVWDADGNVLAAYSGLYEDGVRVAD